MLMLSRQVHGSFLQQIQKKEKKFRMYKRSPRRTSRKFQNALNMPKRIAYAALVVVIEAYVL
jgi:hypothetical protein